MNDADVIVTKLQRFSTPRYSPTVLDLFAGCGGLSLGFQSAGFRLLGAVEADRHAARSHAANFFEDSQELHGRAHDITDLKDPAKFVRSLLPHGADPREAVDVIIGGPPCQAFTRVGRAKLREILRHPEAFRVDPRVGLYESYLKFVEELSPVAVVMENVIDILNHGGRNVPEESICPVLEALGYECRYTTLNAVHYGVPQMRERFFLVGIRKELGPKPAFPRPTHVYELPRGYDEARHIALLHVPPGSKRYLAVPGTGRMPAVTAEEALRDLPPFTLHKEGKLRKAPAQYTTLAPYRSDVAPSDYGWQMRKWPGFVNEEEGGVYDHLIRFLPRDYPIFARMKPGDQYPEAYDLACRMFVEELELRRAAGEDLQEGSPAYERLRKSMVPGYDPHKFPNKWRKMEADQPARTLMAHLGKDSYTHIHYSDDERRTISIREAARLQSFPDGFEFCGAMNPAFRQIGNAVPPLLAKAVAKTLLKTLRSSVRQRELVEV